MFFSLVNWRKDVRRAAVSPHLVPNWRILQLPLLPHLLTPNGTADEVIPFYFNVHSLRT